MVKSLAAWEDRAAHHALHGRGAVPGRPGGRDRRRADRRRRAPSSLAGRDQCAPGSPSFPPGTTLPPDVRESSADGMGGARRRGPRHPPRLTGWAVERASSSRGSSSSPALEDVYLELTGDRPEARAAAAEAAISLPPARRAGGGAAGAIGEHDRAHRQQSRYVNKAFWRNPASAFFTFAFPLMFLVIFTALLGRGRSPGRTTVRVHVLRRGDGGLRGHLRVLHQRRDDHHLPARRGVPEADERHPASPALYFGAVCSTRSSSPSSWSSSPLRSVGSPTTPTSRRHHPLALPRHAHRRLGQLLRARLCVSTAFRTRTPHRRS